MRNEQELVENVAAADWRLTVSEREEIDAFFEDEDVPTYVDAEQAT
jgi:diketogulonate reductase-like aldo/keto reductase